MVNSAQLIWSLGTLQCTVVFKLRRRPLPPSTHCFPTSTCVVRGIYCLPLKVREEGQYHSNSPPPFTPEDLGVIVDIPTLIDCPRHKRKRKTGNIDTQSPSHSQEVITIPITNPLEDSPAEMPLQKGRVTLAQILGLPTMPQGQTPPWAVTTTVSTLPPSPPVITATIAPTHETRAGRKWPRGVGSEQPYDNSWLKELSFKLRWHSCRCRGCTSLREAIYGGRGTYKSTSPRDGLQLLIRCKLHPLHLLGRKAASQSPMNL